MRVTRCVLFLCALLFAAGLVFPQTVELGQGVYYSEAGQIILAVDDSIAVMRINSPYVMFMAFMAARGDQTIDVHRQDVTMVYKAQEYHMPALKEIAKAYKGMKEDAGLYTRFGKEIVLFDKMRYYTFPYENEFFPTPGFGPTAWVDQAEFVANRGFKTKLYFKNPGFAKGDEVTFKVFDRKHPESTAEVTVILK